MLVLAFLFLGISGCVQFTGVKAIQESAIQLNPNLINNSSQQITGPHLVYETKSPRNGKLLVTVGGTSSRPNDFLALQKLGMSLGYDVVAIDYPNSVTTVRCRQTKDPNCFDKYHREIIFGEPVSPICEVDESNSIAGRVQDLLRYMSEQSLRWKDYYKEGKVDWSKLVFVGHSQGSGHVAYLAKRYPVDRVLLIAGPQDNYDPHPAAWLSKEGITAKERYFALIHKKDFYKANLQLSAFGKLIGMRKPEESPQVILSDKPVKDAHMEVIQAKFSDEWTHLLGH